MKKIYLFSAMTLLMVGCSSSDEENLPADMLLAGTEWQYNFLYLPPIESTTNDTVTFNPIETYFPNIQLIYIMGNITSTVENDTIEHIVSEPQA